ncbi:hypothetical protein PEC18_07540 [Paucibacter sp. O1-1]|nr:hypothetical protein [Paucibacter sp. O1-1]MDA3825724.1 hypothetical protein [Paucibacter sp. O1-1]
MKQEIDQLADRHLRPDPLGVLIVGAVTKVGVVRVMVSAAMASSRGGQHLAWMLVNLLARQFKVVREILLDVPAVPTLDAVAPFGRKATLGESLLECVRLVSGQHVGARFDSSSALVDISLGIGDVPASGAEHWSLYADGWRYCISTSGSPGSGAPSSGLAIGPYLCAAVAAGEVFKIFRGMKPGKGSSIESHFASAWTQSMGAGWHELEDGPQVHEVGSLPHFYFAGAGAVAQAAAACLIGSGFKGSATVIDKDALDLSNDNRYVLSNLSNDLADKAELLATHLMAHGFSAKAAPVWWQEFTISHGCWAPDAHVAALEREYKLPIVLSCVDKNLPRHAIQQALPGLIIGGSSDGLTAKASIVHLGLGTACLKCHNPLRSRNEIIRQKADHLRTMAPDARRAYCEANNLDDAIVDRVLGPSECGKLTEADLSRFADDAPEMSVGFVSAAAGVLLVSQLVRVLALGPEQALRHGAMVMATFARAGLRPLRVGRDQGCDCHAVPAGRWRQLWTGAQHESWGDTGADT